jgi:hypothetical protein
MSEIEIITVALWKMWGLWVGPLALLTPLLVILGRCVSRSEWLGVVGVLMCGVLTSLIGGLTGDVGLTCLLGLMPVLGLWWIERVSYRS